MPVTVDVGAVVTGLGGLLAGLAAVVAARSNRDSQTDERLRAERNRARAEVEAWRGYARALIRIVARHNRDVAASGGGCELLEIPPEPAISAETGTGPP